MYACELQQEFRSGHGQFIRNRRFAFGSSLVAMSTMGLIALYQVGILKRLPGPKSRHWDAEKVHGSEKAYSLLGTPDAVLGLASYAATIALTASGSAERSRVLPWIPVVMCAKTTADAIYACKLSVDQWTEFRAFSIWSLLASGATVATLRFALPEAKAALTNIFKR